MKAGFVTFVSLAVASGATTPVPAAGVGTIIWSTTTTSLLVWNGTAWVATAAGGSGGGYTTTAQATSFTETATSGEVIRRITAPGQTVTLPTAVGNTAKLTYKLMVAGTFIIDGAGTETVEGALTATLSTQDQAVTLISDNANWIII